MGDETNQEFSKYKRQVHGLDRPPPDLDKARAERRASVAQDIEDGLIADTPAARNTDPETSHEAIDFMRSSGIRATHQKIVLAWVRRLPGLTYLELAKQTGLDKHEVMKRLNDLQGEAPPLVRKGAPRAAPGHRACSTWWPT